MTKRQRRDFRFQISPENQGIAEMLGSTAGSLSAIADVKVEGLTIKRFAIREHT